MVSSPTLFRVVCCLGSLLLLLIAGSATTIVQVQKVVQQANQLPLDNLPRFFESKVTTVKAGDTWNLVKFVKFFTDDKGAFDNQKIKDVQDAVAERRTELTKDKTFQGKLPDLDKKAADIRAWSANKITAFTTLFGGTSTRTESDKKLTTLAKKDSDLLMNLQNLVQHLRQPFSQ